MTESQKKEIVDLLRQRKEDQNLSLKAISKMSKVASEATISDILTGKWLEKNHISDKVWTQMGVWLGYKSWMVVRETTNAKMVMSLCQLARKSPQAFGIISEPGLGKSESLKTYAAKHKNVAYLECAVYWTKKTLLQELLSALGESQENAGIPEMFQAVIESLKRSERPLIIIDEADKLKDGVIDLFNALYNATLNHAGWIISGAPYLEKRIEKGRRLNKQSYKEIFSRIGREYHRLRDLTPRDIRLVCEANSIEDAESIQHIINNSMNDMRRVKNLVEKLKAAAEHEEA